MDAFRGSYLKKTQNPDNAFILTHYHGDHYGNLPKENKYQGPALIHCTPPTAALLRNVHEVPSFFVVEHSYGKTFIIRLNGKASQNVQITFYDANHCPGAAIVFFELPTGSLHLHTGDMRYHERMKSYPLLRNAVTSRTLDTVYLDTTYANPKHDFMSQDVAVDSIASQVHSLLGSERNHDGKTLVLLSCYSIGKEKILWEASNRCNQLVYVTERKLQMLRCIEGNEEVSSQIIHRCTRQAEKSDLHVIPMGVAGQIWPFFQPNFQACAKYVQELSRPYNRVVAFIPTGWAEASNWNKKNAVSQASLHDIEIEVRLIGYSEHSAFSELQAFVQFLKPRKVVPTVFKDESDARKIEARFPIDLNRAKKHFIDSMFCTSSTSPTRNVTERKPEKVQQKRKRDSNETGFVDNVVTLRAMGFEEELASSTLERCSGDMETAVEELLTGQRPKKTIHAAAPKSSTLSRTEESKKSQHRTGNLQITRFFAPRR